MINMIEKVARAIDGICNERGFPLIPRYAVNHIAGAAVEAMREPSNQMIDKGANKHCGDDSMTISDFDEQVKDIYQAMIDEALK